MPGSSLRASRDSILRKLEGDRIGASERGPAWEELRALLTDLVEALERGALPPIPMEQDAPAASYQRVAAALLAFVEEVRMPWSIGDSRILHAWVCQGFDHATRKLAQDSERMARDGERFRMALASGRVGVVEIDRDLYVRWSYNPAAPGFDEAMLGKSIYEHPIASDAAVMATAMSNVLTSGVGARFEVRSSGHFNPSRVGYVDLLVSMEPVRDAAGTVVGVRGAAIDITRIKEVQAALEQAVALRERMTAVLAHDLRNPLSAIVTISGYLSSRDSVPERVVIGLGQISTAARRMLEMIGTLLDFSVARHGGGILVLPVLADLGVICRDALEELRNANPGRSIELASTGALDGEWDPARLAQVVSNLVGNALSHGSPDDPVHVLASRDGEVAVLVVRNHGPVLDAATVPQLFEPFHRAETSIGKPGLGLGLYIVKEIVTAHGGSVGVESTAREGTSFTVRLPRARS